MRGTAPARALQFLSSLMPAALSTLIVLNTVLFAALGFRMVFLALRAESPYLRALAWVVVGACGAFVLGSAQKLTLQAVTAGWINEEAVARVATQWQMVQSLAALGVGLAGFWILSRAWTSIGLSEHVASTLAGRLPDVDLDDCGLTDREMDVVRAIGRGHLSDREIADELFIAPSTAATHVKRVLRKTGLNSRRELIFLAGTESS